MVRGQAGQIILFRKSKDILKIDNMALDRKQNCITSMWFTNAKTSFLEKLVRIALILLLTT